MRRIILRAACAALALAAAGCARPEPPSGGPPDLTPPVIESSQPDSGAVNVGRLAPLLVTFSKRMDHRSVEDYVFTSPPIRFDQASWSGRTLELPPLDSLRANTTYFAVIGTGARDVHGNALGHGENLVFSTGPRLARGRVGGRVESPRGAAGLFVWLYEDSLHADSTWGRDDPEYTVQTGADGRFEILGLSTGRRYSLHVWGDANHNRAYDTESEYMLNVPRRVLLGDSAAVDTSFLLTYVDPKLPGSLAGRLDTTLTGPRIAVRVEATFDTATSQTLLPDLKGGFLLRAAPPGKYRIYWFDDTNQDRLPSPGETRGDALEFQLQPGEDLADIRVSRQGPPTLPKDRKEPPR